MISLFLLLISRYPLDLLMSRYPLDLLISFFSSGQYHFKGDQDLLLYLDTAKDMGLDVILRYGGGDVKFRGGGGAASKERARGVRMLLSIVHPPFMYPTLQIYPPGQDPTFVQNGALGVYLTGCLIKRV